MEVFKQLRWHADVKLRYTEILSKIPVEEAKPHGRNPAYDWGGWADRIRNVFSGGVPLGFLGNDTISCTMVFRRRRGIAATRPRDRGVANVLGRETARKILREDIVGLLRLTPKH